MSAENPLPGEAGYEEVYGRPYSINFNNQQEMKKSNKCCEMCINGGGGCRWSNDLKPVKGWIAEETELTIAGSMKGDTTFIIKWCPEFRRGDKISENVEAIHKSRREPYEMDDEGFLKLAERIVFETAEGFKECCNIEKQKRKVFMRNHKKWEDYYSAYTSRKQYNDVFNSNIRNKLMKQADFNENPETEAIIEALAEEKRKKDAELRQEQKEQAEANAERLKQERLARLEAEREQRKEQKRIDKKLSKEVRNG